MRSYKFKLSIIFLVILIIFPINPLLSQEKYKVPPPEIIKILEAPPFPRAILNPNRDLMLLVDYESMPSIAELAKPFLRLAGIRITPHNNSQQQLTYNTGLSLLFLKTNKIQKISLPEGIKFGMPRWSPDGAKFAFLRYKENGIEIWVVNAITGSTNVLNLPPINAVLTSGFIWLPGGQKILAFTVPEGRGAIPLKPIVPEGPDIQETAGKFSRAWTYQDLLTSPYDCDMFDYYATSQLIEVDINTGATRKIGPPGVYSSAEYSPDGNYILIDRIKRPYSYHVPYRNFPHSYEIWDKDGNFVHLVADLPLADEVPVNGVPKGVRSPEWQPLKSASLIWVEALDEGDPEKQVPHRDKIMVLNAPFKDQPIEIMRLENRFAGIEWLGQPGLAFVTETNWRKRWRTTFLKDFEHPEKPARKIFDLSTFDAYNDPGRPVTISTIKGERIALQEKEWIYLAGSGASPEGDRPFLDRFNLVTGEKKRLFRCPPKRYESFVGFSGISKDIIIITSESQTEPPNYFLYNLKTNKKTPLTNFPDPAPQLTAMRKQLIKYKRNDGVELSGMLYLPPGYNEGERLPVVVWAYPREYTDPQTAGQVRGSPYRFTFLRGASQLFFVTQGYAVLDDAQMPVIGDPKTVNDTFVDQIVANAKAAIDTLEALGIADPKRVGVGGHSYGAFMTANLLAHSDLFSAGIARSGAYNRTLTPFGFQNERRTLWEAPETYIKMSPFMFAHKINEPILLIHGQADNNAGT
ncbi:MAG: prolyl oligopeptidase family serine peptidase, partial [Candidatus Aminicenantes bacterium]|nr:prolyl oligopeptidase family serine peptidase [Candidatus Aminicenantes bacterium]